MLYTADSWLIDTRRSGKLRLSQTKAFAYSFDVIHTYPLYADFGAL